jgi:hypothetical protein
MTNSMLIFCQLLAQKQYINPFYPTTTSLWVFLGLNPHPQPPILGEKVAPLPPILGGKVALTGVGFLLGREYSLRLWENER